MKTGPAKFPILTVISPTRWESQENRNVSINAINLALDQFPILKALYITFNFVFRNEVVYPFVECDHCFHRCLVNYFPEFINCFRFNNLSEIFLPKYFTDLSWVIGGESIVAVENQFKGSSIFCFETNVRKLIWITIFFCDRQPTRISHSRPEKVLQIFCIG